MATAALIAPLVGETARHFQINDVFVDDRPDPPIEGQEWYIQKFDGKVFHETYRNGQIYAIEMGENV